VWEGEGVYGSNAGSADIVGNKCDFWRLLRWDGDWTVGAKFQAREKSRVGCLNEGGEEVFRILFVCDQH
jgi:hypothetical protein